MRKSALYGMPGNIRRLATEAQQRVGDAFAEYVRGELRVQHLSGRNLYGERFPKPRSGGVPMLDTGLLMDGYQVRVLDGGKRITVGNVVLYSKFLNSDGEHEHLPEQNNVPPKWAAKLEKIKAAELKRFYREVRAALGLKGTIS